MSGRPRVLVTLPLLDPAPRLLAERVEIVERTERPLADDVPGCDAVVCQYRDQIDDTLLRTAGLRIVATVATGYDNVDLAAATRHGVAITRTAGVLEEAVADHAFALLLAASRRLVEGDQWVRSGTWPGWALDQLLGQDLHGATLGLIGFGGIAQAVARRARGFGLRVVYTARHRRPETEEAAHEVAFRSLPELLAGSDLVSLHVPLSEATRHLIGAPELALMRPTAVLVNTSRGPIVDEAALAEALAAGRLFGAGLDVFEREPQVDPGLLTQPRVVLTPHAGSGTRGTRSAMCVAAVASVLDLFAGRRPHGLVNGEVLG